MLDVSDVFREFEANYTRTRFTIINTFDGESKVPSTKTIRAYVHPDDYKATMYSGQGDRLEERVKIFCKIETDLIDGDEIGYKGKQYRVMREAPRHVGSYTKLIAELIR